MRQHLHGSIGLTRAGERDSTLALKFLVYPLTLRTAASESKCAALVVRRRDMCLRSEDVSISHPDVELEIDRYSDAYVNA